MTTMLTGDPDANELFDLLYELELRRCANPALHRGGRFDPKQIAMKFDWKPKRFTKATEALDEHGFVVV